MHERMLESYVVARERFLKPRGRMFPTTGSIIFSPLTDEAIHKEQAAKAAFWDVSECNSCENARSTDEMQVEQKFLRDRPELRFAPSSRRIFFTGSRRQVNYLTALRYSLNYAVLQDVSLYPRFYRRPALYIPLIFFVFLVLNWRTLKFRSHFGLIRQVTSRFILLRFKYL